MSLTVLAIADQVNPLLYDHFSRDRWGNIDLILSCGDLPPEYLDFLCSSLNVPLLYVRGNHDADFSADRYCGCIDVHGKIVTCKGLRIAGFQGCRLYNRGEYQYTERQMQRMVYWTRLRAHWKGRPDIVLTHAPAAGYHDGEDLCHQGFEAFNKAVREWQPEYLVHGHTHAYNPGEAVTTVGPTTIINAFPYHVFTAHTVQERAPRPVERTTPAQETKPLGVGLPARTTKPPAS